jgi:CHAT domain-containing protein/Tfp pilus assembly protein PilF
MNRFFQIVLVAAAFCACTNRSERQLDSTLETARAALMRGKLADARTWADRGIALTKSDPDSEWAWKFRLLQGEVRLASLQLEQMLPLLKETLPAGPRFDALRARQKYLEARTQVVQGRMPEALATLEKARLLAVSDGDTELDVDVLAGQVFIRLGRWTEADTRLTAAIARASERRDRYREVLAFNNLGMNRLYQNKFDEALPMFERVLAFTDLEQVTVYATALYNAGICHSRLGQFDLAVSRQRRAVELNERRGPSVNLEQALGVLGETYVWQGNPRQGLVYLDRAFTIATDSRLSADAKVAADAAIWANALAGAHADLREWDDAERFNNDGKRLEAATPSGKPVYNTLTAAQIAKGRGQLDEAARLFDDALADPTADPWIRWSAHAGLGNIASAQKRLDRAVSHFEAALDTIEQTRSRLLQTDYKLSYLTRLIAFYRDYVDALVDQGQVDRAMDIADSSRARVLADRQGAALPARGTATMFRRVAAQPHRVLLSYWLAPARSYLWVVTAAGVRCVPLPPAAEIETLVREYQKSIASSAIDPLAVRDTAGDRLYRMLVQPAEQSLRSSPGSSGSPRSPRDASVVIVPDGALYGLNFETLPVDGPQRHYWIDDVEIRVAPSLAMLSAGTPTRASGRQSLLIIGNPTATDPEFPLLRNAPAEMASIARHFSDADIVTVQGERATPDAYRGAHPEQFAMVHFAAHAVANLYSPLDSAVILARDQHAYKLYARDVAEQPLQAELVTVSACRSAGERAYSGEGLIGFAWAFLRAGARRVIAGLWDVDDQSTAELMDSLYARLAAGDSPARALREAKRTLMRKGGNFAKPYYWGPFELFTVSP